MNSYTIVALLVVGAALTQAVTDPRPGPPGHCPHSCPPTRCGHDFPGNTPYSCPGGYDLDRCGCEIQSCQCAGCPYFDRSVYCLYGYRTKQGCPTSECHYKPPLITHRCPNNQEPKYNQKNLCQHKSHCHAPQVCCRTYGSDMRCMDGIKIH